VSFGKAIEGVFTRSIFTVILLGISLHYKNGLAYLLDLKSNLITQDKKEKRFSDIRNFQLLSKYKEKVVGLDVSEYQGVVDWKQVRLVENNFPIRFVFIRATAGVDKVDFRFNKNWNGAKANDIIRGAYHYYRLMRIL